MEGNKQYRVLSIDAWADGEDSWQWNNWFMVDTFTGNIDNEAECLEYLQQFVKPEYTDKVEIEDDQANIVLVRKDTRQPLFAIEYYNVQ